VKPPWSAGHKHRDHPPKGRSNSAWHDMPASCAEVRRCTAVHWFALERPRPCRRFRPFPRLPLGRKFHPAQPCSACGPCSRTHPERPAAGAFSRLLTQVSKFASDQSGIEILTQSSNQMMTD